RYCSGGAGQKSALTRNSASFNFRLLQHNPPEAANREWHLGEITAHFVTTIRRSLWSAVEGGMAEKPSCLLLSTNTCQDLGIRDCSSVKRNRSNPSTFGRFAFDWRFHANGATLHSST